MPRAARAVQRRERTTDVNTKSDEALITRWIEPNPHRPEPAEAWVLSGCVAVWVVIRQLELEQWKPQGVADEYGLEVEAVRAAVAYYHRNRDEIDARIARNRAFFGT